MIFFKIFKTIIMKRHYRARQCKVIFMSGITIVRKTDRFKNCGHKSFL